MSLLPFLLVTGIGAIVAIFVRGSDRFATAVGLVALAAAFVTALTIRPGEAIVVGDGGLATTEYLRLFLVLGSIVGLLLAIVGGAIGGLRDVPAMTLGILATSALALALPDARAAVLAATTGGAFGALLAIAPGGGRTAATAGIRALRAAAVAGAMAIAATAWIGRDLSELAAQPIVFGLAYLAFALAVAVRFGAIPVHTWAARMADAVPETSLPLVTAVGPAALAIVALAWADASIAPLLLDLDQVRAVVLLVAIASIVFASIAAFIQDDIEHIVGYAIVGDSGVVLLAIAALDPDAWAPARTWILAFVVARSAFAAWAAVTRATFGTGKVNDLRGWMFRAPLLAVVLGAVVLASIGVPGLAAAEARGRLIELVLDGPLAIIVLVGTLGPLAY
ncbi:MAG: proton-conducting transporter membrane subunit, partial [Candidatus Limnocylindrales bacterium]